ncbi:MAG: metallophosphoesterase [Muribaculaceae bacterium]|nr:metallophosphoesterase [Muribaculaceae bacterium]
MRLPLIPILFVLVLGILIDLYIWKALRKRCKYQWVTKFHCVTAVLVNAALLVAICLPRRQGSNALLLTDIWLIYTCMSVFIPKLLWIIFDLVAKIPRLWHGRLFRPLSWLGLGLAVVLFALFWQGALFGRTALKVEETTVEIKDLPKAFDGYRIAFFSDLHTGSYGTDTTFVARVVRTINDLHPDLIVFTGDIVNRNSDELLPFANTLSQLKAPDGVDAILGNHDYGDYTNWPSLRDKAENMRLLYRTIESMHWKLLRDSTVWVVRGADSLAVIGVENIGDAPFPTYGSLSKAYPQVADSHTKILLTHNPRHWEDSIADNPAANIHLTLSGHTHAMQMQIGSWSPASFRYKLWGGLYGDSLRRSLFVNIGIGMVGFPARILNANPTITLITLRPSKQP